MNELHDTDDSSKDNSSEISYRQVLKKLSNLVDISKFKSILEQERIPNIDQLLALKPPPPEQSFILNAPLTGQGKNINSETSWTLLFRHEVDGLKLGDDLTKDDEDTLNFLLKRNCLSYPFSKKNQNWKNDKWSVHKEPKHQQRSSRVMMYLKCSGKGCPCKYKVMQFQGGYATYKSAAIHDHSIFDRNDGLLCSIEMKKVVIQNLRANQPSKLAYDRIIFNEKISNLCIDKSKLIEDTANKHQIIRKMVMNMQQTIGKEPHWIDRQDNAFKEIGMTMDGLISFVKTHSMAVDDFAKLNIENYTETEMKQLIVLASDVGKTLDNSWTYLLITTPYMLQVHDAAISVCHDDEQGHTFHGDYTHNVIGGARQIGCLGAVDKGKTHHAILWDINISENSDGFRRVLCVNEAVWKIRFVKKFGDNYIIPKNKCLIDGSVALKKGAKNMLLEILRCLAHMIRNGSPTSPGGSHGSGTRGSLPKYLSKTKSCKDEDVQLIIDSFQAIRHLAGGQECWNELRPLMMIYCEEELFNEKSTNVKRDIMKNIFDTQYFTEVLYWSYKHNPGSAHSTNGQEKSFDYLKKEVAIISKEQGGDAFRLQALFTYIASYQFKAGRKDYVSVFPEKQEDWDKVFDFRHQIPPEYRLMVWYDDKHMLLTDSPFTGDNQLSSNTSYTIYIPTARAMNAVLHEYRNKHINLSEHSSSSKYGENKSWWKDPLKKFFLCNSIFGNVLMKETPYALPGEGYLDYIHRRCIRMSSSVSDSRYNKSKKMKTHAASSTVNQQIHHLDYLQLEKDQELLKWDVSDISNDGKLQKKQKRKVKKHDKTPVRNSLTGAALGNFIKVTVHTHTVGQSGIPRSNIRCNCEDYRRDGTCQESKLFGLLHRCYPPDNCIDHLQVKPWSSATTEILDALEDACITWEEDCIDNKERTSPPIKDPWYQDRPDASIQSNV